MAAQTYTCEVTAGLVHSIVEVPVLLVALAQPQIGWVAIYTGVLSVERMEAMVSCSSWGQGQTPEGWVITPHCGQRGLSRSLQRRLTRFSRVCSPDTIRAPLSKLQAAVEDAAFHLFRIPQDLRAAAMGLPHSLVRQQLRLPLREGGFDLNAAGGCPHPPPPCQESKLLPINQLLDIIVPLLSCTLP